MKILIISFLAFIGIILFSNKDVLTDMQLLSIILPVILIMLWGVWYTKQQPTMEDVLFGAIETAKQLSNRNVVGQTQFDASFPKNIKTARKSRISNK